MGMYQGELFDGSSTIGTVVSINLTLSGIDLEFPNGFLRTVLYFEIKELEQTAQGFRCVFPNADKEITVPCVLEFSDKTLYVALRDHTNATKGALQGQVAKFWQLRIWQIFSIVLVLLGTFIFALFAGVQQAYRLTPITYDNYLGRQFDSTLVNFYQVCTASEIDQFLEKSLTRLKQPTDKFTHKIIVLNDPTKNAVALPGGTIYLFRGLLEESRSPDEILGVLSHEIAHSEQRHTVRQMIYSSSMGYIISLAVGIAIEGFDLLENLETTLELSSVLLMLRYSRKFENEADSLAILRLHSANLKVGSLDSLLTRISPPPRTRDKVLGFFSTHPLHTIRTNRFQSARKLETFADDTTFTYERIHWERIKRGCPPVKDSIPLWKKILR